MPKSNYYARMEEQIDSLNGSRPRLLLHSCCGPCSSAVLELLTRYFSVTLFYDNPNIAPEAEYFRRLEEQRRLLSEAPFAKDVTLIEGVYDTERFYAVTQGLEYEKEGGKRCEKCFRLRLSGSAALAKEMGIGYLTTTLSVSPHKNAETLNRIGAEQAEKHGLVWLYADFKKKEGYKRSLVLSEAYGMYRQDYCGCAYSKRDSDAWRERKRAKDE